MKNAPPPANEDKKAVRAEVRKLVQAILREAEDEAEAEESPLKRWKPLPPRRTGLWGQPPAPKEPEPSLVHDEDDWDLDVGSDFEDPGAAEVNPGEDEPYPEEYLKNQGYPDIGEDPERGTWEDLEKEIAGSAWEPASELDKFRGRDVEEEIDQAAAAVDNAVTNAPKKPKEAVGGEKSWAEIADALGTSVGAVHGAGAIGARKLAYVSEYLGKQGFEDFFNQTTDKYIEFLIKQGAEKDPETGKPMLSMGEVMDLRSASMFDRDEDGDQVDRSLDGESIAIRKAIQELEGFREFLNLSLEHEMELDGYAVSHKDAAKNKDTYSVFHRMKRTTR